MNRAWLRNLALSGIAIGAATAQPAPSEKELRLRFGNASARASAWFQCADAFEARLRDDASTLHPQIATLRGQIEAALDEAHAALDRNDAAEAGEAIVRAQDLLDRFAHHFGS
jgi:ElaB/YqjD/DUF883 family membrane-anchored ribosome-binding protein